MVKSSNSNGNEVLHNPSASNASMGAPGSAATAATQRKRPYKGVRMRSWGSWVSEIRAPNQKTRIWLGSYSTPEAAARAYDAALLCLKGSSASLNFPLSANHYYNPSNTLMSPKSIQRVAAAAAAAANATNAVIPLASQVATPSPSPLPLSPPSTDSLATEDSVSSATCTAEENSLQEHEYHLSDTLIDFAMFDSPKCMDPMLGPCPFFEPCQPEEFEDDAADILLWSFS